MKRTRLNKLPAGAASTSMWATVELTQCACGGVISYDLKCGSCGKGSPAVAAEDDDKDTEGGGLSDCDSEFGACEGEPAELATKVRRQPQLGIRRGTIVKGFREVQLKNGSTKVVPRVLGSVPRQRTNGMCQEQRDALMRQKLSEYEESSDKNSANAICALFAALLIRRGDHTGTMRSDKRCSMDGNVFKYPAYTRKFIEGGAMRSLADFQVDNRGAALEFAARHAAALAPSQKQRGKAWLELTAQQQQQVERRLRNLVMHGFDDLVDCLGREFPELHSAHKPADRRLNQVPGASIAGDAEVQPARCAPDTAHGEGQAVRR